MKKNFEDILNQWEEKIDNGYNKTKKESGINIMKIALIKYAPKNQKIKTDNEDYEHQNFRNAMIRKQLKDMVPQASIDLHGMTTEEAKDKLDSFFKKCRQKGLKKILIIHGKGIHSKDKPVLKEFTKKYLENQKYAGETGYSKKADGKTGSTWVILKK